MGDTWGIRIGLPSLFPSPPNSDLYKLKLNPDLKGRTHLNQLVTEGGGGGKEKEFSPLLQTYRPHYRLGQWTGKPLMAYFLRI